MLKRSLVIIIDNDYITGEIVAAASCPLIGDFSDDRIVPIIRDVLNAAKGTNLFNGNYVKRIFEDLQKGIQLVSFSQFPLSDYIFDSDRSSVGEFINVYDYVYIINVTNSYQRIYSNSPHLPQEINSDGLILAPESMIVLEAIPTLIPKRIAQMEELMIEYVIDIREKIGS